MEDSLTGTNHNRLEVTRNIQAQVTEILRKVQKEDAQGAFSQVTYKTALVYDELSRVTAIERFGRSATKLAERRLAYDGLGRRTWFQRQLDTSTFVVTEQDFDAVHPGMGRVMGEMGDAELVAARDPEGDRVILIDVELKGNPKVRVNTPVPPAGGKKPKTPTTTTIHVISHGFSRPRPKIPFYKGGCTPGGERTNKAIIDAIKKAMQSGAPKKIKKIHVFQCAGGAKRWRKKAHRGASTAPALADEFEQPVEGYEGAVAGSLDEPIGEATQVPRRRSL
ncbi:MAG: hypothetical protein ACE5F1_02745 [Planctomycetota bacterium]